MRPRGGKVVRTEAAERIDRQRRGCGDLGEGGPAERFRARVAWRRGERRECREVGAYARSMFELGAIVTRHAEPTVRRNRSRTETRGHARRQMHACKIAVFRCLPI